MSSRTSKRKSQRSRPARKRNSRRGRRSSRRRDPLVWLAIVPVAIVVVLVLNAWQSGAFAAAPDPSRVGDPESLPPLAKAGRVLHGGYNRTLVPQQTPAPQAAPADGPAPLIEMPARSHDFGRIYERWDVTHVFVVENSGDADLAISNLATSCGCTTAELSSSVIPPGERICGSRSMPISTKRTARSPGWYGSPRMIAPSRGSRCVSLRT